MFFIIVFGVLLLIMYQFLMGLLMILVGYKVYLLWQSYEMLLLFLLLMVFIMGFLIVIFEGLLVQVGLCGNGLDEKSLFVKLINIISVLLVIFIVLCFGEFIYCDKLLLVFVGDFYFVMFWIEVLLMFFLLVVLCVVKLCNDFCMLFLLVLSVLLGCVIWCLIYLLVVFNLGGGYVYFLIWEELLIFIGFVVIEICVYIVFICLLLIFFFLK